MRVITVTKNSQGDVLLDNQRALTVQSDMVKLEGHITFEVYSVHAPIRVSDHGPDSRAKLIQGASGTDCIVTSTQHDQPAPPWDVATTDAILTLAPFVPTPEPGYSLPVMQVAAAVAVVSVLAFGALGTTSSSGVLRF